MTGIAYDDNGEIVPVAMPPDPDACPTCGKSYADDGPTPDAVHEERLVTIAWVLAILLDGASDLNQVGKRAFALGYLLKHDAAPRSLAGLGAMFGTSRQAAHVALTAFRAELAQKRLK
jgi:hypothetical protein